MEEKTFTNANDTTEVFDSEYYTLGQEELEPTDVWLKPGKAIDVGMGPPKTFIGIPYSFTDKVILYVHWAQFPSKIRISKTGGTVKNSIHINLHMDFF